MRPTNAEIRERVARGYRWLKKAGWAYDLDVSRVDPTTLNVAWGDRCVLWQARGMEEPSFYFYDLIRELHQASGGAFDEAWLVQHGFDAEDGRFNQTYERLTAEWFQVLTEKRGKVSV